MSADYATNQSRASIQIWTQDASTLKKYFTPFRCNRRVAYFENPFTPVLPPWNTTWHLVTPHQHPYHTIDTPLLHPHYTLITFYTPSTPNIHPWFTPFIPCIYTHRTHRLHLHTLHYTLNSLQLRPSCPPFTPLLVPPFTPFLHLLSPYNTESENIPYIYSINVHLNSSLDKMRWIKPSNRLNTGLVKRPPPRKRWRRSHPVTRHHAADVRAAKNSHLTNQIKRPSHDPTRSTGLYRPSKHPCLQYGEHGDQSLVRRSGLMGESKDFCAHEPSERFYRCSWFLIKHAHSHGKEESLLQTIAFRHADTLHGNEKCRFLLQDEGGAGCGFSSSNKTWSSSSNSLSSVNAASPRKMRKPVRDYTVQTIINEELWLGVFCIYSLGNSLLYLLTRILHEEKYRCKNIQTKNCDTKI